MVDRPETREPRGKFVDPLITADGEERARVRLEGLQTLWFNTGTLCNLECGSCYIESSPRNDRLAYLETHEVLAYLDEIEREGLGTAEIGFTGGEPFMNPQILAMLEACLERGFRVLVLTNAMRPMMKRAAGLTALRARYGATLKIRVSVDHFRRELHEEERGARSWEPLVEGLRWLGQEGFALDIAGRTRWGESEDALREGYAALFAELGLAVDARDPAQLVLFPEMDERAEVPEITARCWGILDLDPGSLMCASSRMVVRRKGSPRSAVLACTLLPYDEAFELGHTLAEAGGEIRLNHPHCAKFCVLGGGSCSAAD